MNKNKNKFYNVTQDGKFSYKSKTERIAEYFKNISGVNRNLSNDFSEQYFISSLSEDLFEINGKKILDNASKMILQSFYGKDSYWKKLLDGDIKIQNYDNINLLLKRSSDPVLISLKYLSEYFRNVYETLDGSSKVFINTDHLKHIEGLGKLVDEWHIVHCIIGLFNGAQELYDITNNVLDKKNSSFFFREVGFKIHTDLSLYSVTEIYPKSFFLDSDEQEEYKYLNFLTVFCDNFIKSTQIQPESDSSFLPQSTANEDYDKFPFYSILADLDYNNISKKYIPTYYCFANVSIEKLDVIYYDGNFQTFDSILDYSFVQNMIIRDSRKSLAFDGDIVLSYSDLEYYEEAEYIESIRQDRYVYDENGNEQPRQVGNNFEELWNSVSDSSKGLEENVFGALVTFVQSGDEDIREIIEERATLIREQKEQRQKLEFQVNYLENISKDSYATSWNILLEAFQSYYRILVNGETQHVNNLNFILNDLEDKHVDNLFSVDQCNIAFMVLYVIYSMNKGKEFGLDNVYSETEYADYKDSLDGIQSLPGWIEINEIRYQEWAPKLKNIDNDFWKYYSTFYNFTTEERNPFNGFIEDFVFEDMQELAIKAKDRLKNDINSEVENKLTELFYGPQDIFNGHSLWTFTNILADVFAELEKPLEIDLWTSSSFGLLDFLKDAAYEMTSNVLLELFISLCNETAIKIGDKGLSLLGFYNDLIIIQNMLKIMVLSKDSETNELQIAEELSNLKASLLDPDGKPNSLGALLERIAYFSKDGLDLFSSGYQNIISILGGYSIDIGDLEEELKQFDPEDDNDLEGVWNLFEANIQTWFLCTVYAQNKLKRDPSASIPFHTYKLLISDLRSMDKREKQYAFLCGIKNRTQFLEDEIDSGVLKGVITLNDLGTITEYFPNSFNDKTYDYSIGYENTIRDLPELFKFQSHPDYKIWLDISERGCAEFSSAALTNRNAIEDELMEKENSSLTDTVARLLPTTSLLINNMEIPLDRWLERIISWFDELLALVLSMIKRVTKDNQIKNEERFTRETYLLLNGNWQLRIRSFSTLLDIIYNSFGTLSFCMSTGTLGPTSATYETLTSVKERLEEIKGTTNPPVTQNPIDNTVRPEDNNNVNIPGNTGNEPIDDETLKKIENGLDGKVVTVVDDGTNGIIKNPILIVPSTDYDPNNKQEIIESVTDGVTIIHNDKELADHLEKPGSSIIIIDEGSYGNKLQDLLLPPSSGIEDGAQQQITDSYIKRDLDTIFQQITDNGYRVSKEQLANDRLKEINEGFGYGDSNHLTTIDFSKINSKLFLKSLNNFNFSDYVNFKYSSLKMFKKF